MKPQNLQDAIKLKALKKKDKISNGGWKEPVVKTYKVTAEDMKACQETEGRGRRGGVGGGGVGDGGGGGASSADTMALKNELAMLRDEMRNNIKLLKDEQRKTAEAAEAAKIAAAYRPTAAAVAPPPQRDNGENKRETEALKKELESVKSELNSFRDKLSGVVDSIPENMKDLREELRQIQEDNATARTSAPSSSDGPVTKDLRKAKSEIKELRMMVSQSQDGTLLAKELRVIVDQQESMLETQAEEVEDLKEQVRLLKRRVETVEYTSKEAMALAEKKSVARASSPTPSSPVPEVIPLSPVNRKKVGGYNKNPSNNAKNGGMEPHESSPLSVKSLEEEEEEDGKQTKQNVKQRLYNDAARPNKLELLHLDSDDEESTDGSDLYPANNAPAPTDSLLTRPRSRQNDDDEPKNVGSRTDPNRNFSPSSIVLDKDGTYTYENEEDSDDDDDDFRVKQSPPSGKKEIMRNTTANQSPKQSHDSKDMHKDYISSPKSPRSPADDKKRATMSSKKDDDDDDDDDSTTSDDDSESAPKKKSISLLPHRSESLYQEQRKDPVLRKFMTGGKSPDMTVHKVHRRNLVFFSEKIYIPASLREQTIDYYHKKHSYNPLIAIQKNCFWPDLEEDMKKKLKKGDTRWKLEVVKTEEIR